MKLIIVCCLFLLSVVLQAQTVEFTGTVLSDKAPIEFALVALEHTPHSVLTDSAGRFLLRHIKPGEYVLLVKAMGFETYRKSISLKENKGTLTIELKSLNSQLHEVVVTGTMKEVSRANSPVSIEVISPKLFQKTPTSNIFEGLSMINGIRPQLQCNVCNTGDIHINGMEGPYTMVLIDGMPIVSALSTVYGMMGIPNSIIERIEVQRGPASSLYGSEAVGGLINIITKQPEKAPLLATDIYVSSYKELNTDISCKWKLNKNLQVLSSINYFNFTTRWDKNKDNFTDVTLQNRISAFNKFSYKRKNNRTAQMAFRYYYEDRFGGEMQWQKKFRGTDSVYGESIYTRRWEIIGIYQLPVKEKLMLRFSLNRHNQNSVYGITPYLAIQQISFAQLTWDKHAGRHNMLAGISLRYTFYDDNTAITARNDGLMKGNHPSHIFLPGLFLQDEIALHSKHTLLAGMRWDQNSMHGTIFSPRVNYKWSPDKHNTLRAGVGNGFRVVNLFSEEHAVYTGARTVEIKETLKPERSWNINLNYTRFHNMKHVFVNMDVGLFYTYFFNRILPDYFSDPNKIIFNNLKGYSVNRGFNVNMDFSFTSALNVSLGFTYTDVFIRSENAYGTSIKTRQVQTPPFTGNYSVSYEIKRWLLTIDWNGSVYSPMLLPVLPNDFRPDHSPWYTLMNLQFTKKWNKTLSCYLGFKNLLNFIPSNPIMRPQDPFDKDANDPVNNPNKYTFDPGYNYAPLQGFRVIVGGRVNIN